MEKTKNYDLIDLTKLIGSVMIIAMHMSAFDDINPQIQFYAVQLLTRWAVPFFFVTSSFFLYRKTNGETNREQTVLYVKRILTLYATWFVINLVSIIYKLYKAGFAHLTTWLVFFRNIFTGSVYTASWYFLAAAFGAVLVYFLSKKLSDKYVLLITFLIYLLCIITSTYSGLLPQGLVDWIAKYIGSTCNNIISGCFYFAFGKLIAKHYDELIKIPRSVCIIFLLLSYALFYIEILTLQSFSVLGTTDASVMLIPVSLFLFLLTSSAAVQIKGSKYLRKMSTIIFCSQGTVNKAACFAAKLLQIPFTYVEFLISCVFMMLVSGVIIFFQKKLKLLKYLT